MNLRPLQDRILLRRDNADAISKGGIHIPEAAKEQPAQGTIVAAGNGRVLSTGEVRALDVSVGDRVLFGKYAGQEVTVDDEKLLMIKEDDVIGVIETV